jgi:ribose transport system substrate-binding protein
MRFSPACVYLLQIDFLKQGYSDGQVGQRPFEMGYKAMFMLNDLNQGKKVADPTYTGLDVCTPKNVATCIGS